MGGGGSIEAGYPQEEQPGGQSELSKNGKKPVGGAEMNPPGWMSRGQLLQILGIL